MVDRCGGRADDAFSRAVRLEGLVLRYREPLLRHFERKGLPLERAEHCTQEVFVRLARTHEDAAPNAEAHLFTVASNVLALHALKGSGRTPPLGVDGTDEQHAGLQRLALALNELPANTREMFLLNRGDGPTYTQIAARYAIGVTAVERHIVRALNHLRLRLSRDT